MKRSVTKEKNPTEQVDNIYNHKRKKTCTTLYVWSHFFYSSFLFFFNNHCVMTEGKLREGGKGSMSCDLFFNLFFSNKWV